MRIYTLGTSHGDSTFSRFNSSTLYEAADGTLYLVDAGAPCEALIRRKGLDIKLLRATFITHMHDDHAAGLCSLIKQIIKYDAGRSIPYSLYLPEATAIEPLKSWIRALHIEPEHPLISYCETTDGVIYDDDNVTVSTYRTDHIRTRGYFEGEPCSFAYILYFKKENVRILHTGDMRGDLADYPKIAFEEEFDMCLCEATHYWRTPEIALPLFMKSKFKRLLFIHVNDPWHVRIEPGWVFTNGEKEFLSYYKDVPYPIQIAHDGDEFLF